MEEHNGTQEGEVFEPQVGPEGSTTEEEGVVTLPSDVEEFKMPEKFAGKTPEEIAKAYVELEKFKGVQPNTPPPETEAPTETSTEGNKYVDEFLKEGALSDASYAELAEQGLSKEEVDDRLEFEQYKQQKKVDELVSVIGGIDNFTAMDEWAKASLTEEQLNTYGSELAAATPYGKKAILKDLYAQYTANTNGTPPEQQGDIIHTNEPQVGTSKGYTYLHDLQADMANSLYGKDRRYT